MLAADGQDSAAIAAASRSIDLDPSLHRGRGSRALQHAMMNRPALALAAPSGTERKYAFCRGGLGYAYIGRGEYDQALDWITRAVRGGYYAEINNREFDPLRTRPKSRELIAAAKLDGQPIATLVRPSRSPGRAPAGSARITQVAAGTGVRPQTERSRTLRSAKRALHRTGDHRLSPCECASSSKGSSRFWPRAA